MHWINPATGPINASNAEPSDHIAITIDEIISLNSQCVTRTAPSKYLLEWLGVDVPQGTHICPIVDYNFYWNEEILIPYKPMIGCIGKTLEIELENMNFTGC